MFRCRTSSVSAASLLRVDFTVYSTGAGGTTRALRHLRAVRCSSVYRRLPDCKAAVSCRSCYITLVGCERAAPCTSLFDTPHVLNATQKRDFGAWTHRDHRRVCEVIEPFASARQMRGASTTPEKTQERAAGVEAVSQYLFEFDVVCL